MYEKDCPYCNLLADPEQQIIFENETCAYIQKSSEQKVLDISGLIVPKRHAVNVFSLTVEEWADTQKLLLKAKVYLEKRYGHDDYSVGWKRVGNRFHTPIYMSFHVLRMSRMWEKESVIGLNNKLIGAILDCPQNCNPRQYETPIC